MAYKIAIIVGSLREGSINRKVARSICGLRGDNLDCSMIEIGDLPLYNQDLDANPPEQWVALPRAGRRGRRRAVRAAPNIIAAFPACSRTRSTSARGPMARACSTRSRRRSSPPRPGSIGGFGANHQIRQACVFLNMPVMQQPEAYLGHVSDDSFDESGCLKDGPLKELITGLAHAFHDWVDMIHRSRQLLAEDSAHAARGQGNTPDTWRRRARSP